MRVCFVGYILIWLESFRCACFCGLLFAQFSHRCELFLLTHGQEQQEEEEAAASAAATTTFSAQKEVRARAVAVAVVGVALKTKGHNQQLAKTKQFK